MALSVARYPFHHGKITNRAPPPPRGDHPIHSPTAGHRELSRRTVNMSRLAICGLSVVDAFTGAPANPSANAPQNKLLDRSRMEQIFRSNRPAQPPLIPDQRPEDSLQAALSFRLHETQRASLVIQWPHNGGLGGSAITCVQQSSALGVSSGSIIVPALGVHLQEFDEHQ